MYFMEQIPEWLRADTARRRAKRYSARQERGAENLRTVVMGTIIITTALAFLLQPNVVTYNSTQYVIPDVCELESVVCDHERQYDIVEAYVTGYNTVPEQTDETPCIAASGHNICGRTDVVACPRSVPLGTTVQIDNTTYTCLDRTAPKYDGRYDISCDKDRACTYAVTGHKTVLVFRQ